MPAAKKKTEDEAAPARFRIDGKEYPVVHIDDLEFSEIELVEEAFDCAIEDIDIRRAKAMRWLVFISMRRAGADITFEDLGELKITDVAEVEQAAKRPTKAATGGA